MYLCSRQTYYLPPPSIMVVEYVVLLALLGIHGTAMPIPIPFDKATSERQLLATTTSTKRTLFNITWNCLSTTIICAWVSMHPNIPPSGFWRALRQRVKMMFWSIIAPELILACAVRQWFAARETRDSYNKIKGEYCVP